MTEDNVESAKRYVNLFDGNVFDYPMDDVAPDVRVDWSESNAPYGGIYEGHQGWRRLFRELRQAFEDAHTEVHEYVVAGPYVAVHNTTHMQGRDGIAVEATSTTVFAFRDGKIVELRLFQDHADALKAIQAG